VLAFLQENTRAYAFGAGNCQGFFIFFGLTMLFLL
jgi:hypothetical protein